MEFTQLEPSIKPEAHAHFGSKQADEKRWAWLVGVWYDFGNKMDGQPVRDYHNPSVVQEINRRIKGSKEKVKESYPAVIREYNTEE